MAKQKKQPESENASLEKELQRLTRKLEVEAALEKVRNRAMAMRNSAELAETSAILFHQINELGIQAVRTGVGIFDDPNNAMELWLTTVSESKEVVRILDYVNLHIHPVFENIIPARKQKKLFALTVLKGNEVKQYYNTMSTYLSLPGKQTYNQEEFFYSFFFSDGAINVITAQGLTEEECTIMGRLANVFGVIYTRFLDLQRAEAQAREAQIEAALERVRATMMAMHQSNGLPEVMKVISDQLIYLDVRIDSVSFIPLHEGKDFLIWTATPKQTYPILIHIPYFDHPTFNRFTKAKEDGDDFVNYVLTKEETRKSWEHYFDSSNAGHLVPESRKEYLLNSKGHSASMAIRKNSTLSIANYSALPFSDEENAILKRFANVFEQAYTRFLDIQKAEAQAREAQIEAALERVRSRSMAMHKSEELREVIQRVFEQLRQLGFNIDSALFDMNHGKGLDFDLWTAVPGQLYSTRQYIPSFDHAWFNEKKKAKENALDFFTVSLTFEEKNAFFRHFFDHIKNVPEERQKYIFDCPGLVSSTTIMGNISLIANNYAAIPYSDEENAILGRFGKVLEQSYTRFLDLQKAETQAREAQIEVALERVRSRSLAMHKSDELAEIVGLIYQQFEDLDFGFYQILVSIYDTKNNIIEWWSKGFGRIDLPQRNIIPIINHSFSNDLLEKWKSGLEYYAHVLEGDTKKSWDEYLFTHTDLKHFPQEVKDIMRSFDRVCLSDAFMKYGSLQAAGPDPLPDDKAEILKRFAKVLDQAYTRMTDLQKAEAQAREAQIEASLERVRSRMMAMHQSEDLPEVMKVITEQFSHLGFDIHAASFRPDITKTDYQLWISTPQKTFPFETFIPYFDHPIFNQIRQAVDNKLDSLVLNVSTEDTRSWWKHFLTNSNVSHLSEKGKNLVLGISAMSVSMAIMKYTLLSIWNYSGKPFSDEENGILKRFAKVAEQTYTRFLELRKAEAQAREATIEAALEKVRGKAMGMHNSNDLSATAGLVFSEVKRLGIVPLRFAVGLLTADSRTSQSYSHYSSAENESVAILGSITLTGHPVLEKVYESWQAGNDYYPELYGDQLKSYYEAITPGLSLPPIDPQLVEQKQYGHFMAISVGYVVAWAKTLFNENEVRILKRFASIVDLTFRRYMELQKSEANALKAVREASLDRVRAEIASMRTTEDLKRITPLIWRELKTLGVPFFRCGLVIAKEKEQMVDFYLSTPEDKPLAAFRLPIQSLEVTSNAVAHWREQKVYKDHWNREQFAAFAKSMIEQGQIKEANTYQGGDVPPESVQMQFVPFVQGMLYVGSVEPLTDAQIDLAKLLADAFSTAYARYEDFNKLESAKVQIEKTLTDLKQTQTQLVQSEKMASLGELTAGIAHEIQNPLNFVNNFSEVSKELLDEMKAELASGNWQPAKEIAESVIQNLEKINFHGKRADGIVKSMLQHSRKSTGQKEPTDINALCDEYLRLSYHGLRAKDKSFNAKFETDLDPTVGSLNVIPQEIGRVILNLINNAFYAVSEKKKLNLNNYEPTVTVTTKKTEKNIEVRVRDNGIGIPQKVLDKIFNPFFTTKPTGQGTGLGLSLSYDIITKGHGGELKVETNEGVGSEFVVHLPTIP